MNMTISNNWLEEMSKNDNGIYSVGGLFCNVMSREMIEDFRNSVETEEKELGIKEGYQIGSITFVDKSYANR